MQRLATLARAIGCTAVTCLACTRSPARFPVAAESVAMAGHRDGSPDAAIAVPPTSEDVIGSVSLPARGGLLVDLVRRDCHDTCLLAVASRSDGPSSVLSLNWTVPPGRVNSAPGLSRSGGVFALAVHRKAQFWSVGEEESSATVGITPVGTEAHPRVLVQAEMGFEHVKRSHALLELSSTGWVMLWSRDDAPGPHGTAVAGTASEGVEGLVYLDAFFDPDDEAADALIARVLSSEGSGMSVTERIPSEATQPVYVLPLREFGTAALAKRALADACLAGTLALPVSRFAARSTAAVALVKIGVDPSVLAEEQVRASECLRAPVGRVQQLLPASDERSMQE